MYINQKNSCVFICDENGNLLEGTEQELNSYPCMLTGNFEIVENLPKEFEQLIYKEDAE